MQREVQIFVSDEDTPGTAQTALAAHAIDATSCDFNEAGPGQIPRQTIRSHFDTEPNLAVPAAYWSGTLETLCLTTPSEGVGGELSVPLQCAGFVETSPASVLTYELDTTPLATSRKSCTIRKEEGPAGEGNVYVAAGVRFGGFRLESDFESAVKLSFPYVGKYAPPVRLDALTTPTYNAGIPIASLKAAANSFYFHSFDVIARSWSLDVGLTANVRKSGGNAGSLGYGYKWPAQLTRSAPVSGEIEVEIVDETEFALWTKYLAATAASSEVVYHGTDLDTKITLRKLQWGKPSPPSGTPLVSRIPFTCHHDGTDGAVAITVYAP